MVVKSCDELGVPVALEFHALDKVPTSGYFLLTGCGSGCQTVGSAIISHNFVVPGNEFRRLRSTFPNQDTMRPKRLWEISLLPVCKGPREQGFSVFVWCGAECRISGIHYQCFRRQSWNGTGPDGRMEAQVDEMNKVG